MSQTFSSLQYYNYRMWFGSALIANIGTWMQRVAQDWLVLTVLTQDSGVALGITTALQFAPTLLLSAWAGSLADSVNRRKLLMLTQMSLGLLALGLGALVLSGVAELWHVYAFAFALGCVSAIDAPVRQTFVAELVPGSQLPNAVALNSASFNTARLIGPATAGLLIAAVGSGWVFIINGITFAVTVWALAHLRSDELIDMPHAKRERGNIKQGMEYVRHRTDIVVIMIVVGVVSAFGLNFQMTSAMMARTEFGKGAGEYGILGSILAIGSLTGALLAARRKRPRTRLVVVAALGFGICEGLLALAPSYEMFALLSIPVGFFSLTMLTSANAAIQMSTDPMMRGRVMSLYLVVLLGATPIGSPIIGWIGEHFGARWSLGVGSIASIAVAIWAFVWTRRHWQYEVSYSWRHRPFVRIAYAKAAESVEPMAPTVTDSDSAEDHSDEFADDDSGQLVDDELNRRDERLDVTSRDRGEHTDP